MHQAMFRKDNACGKRLAELLRDCKHEEPTRRPKWVAIPSNTYVYLEAMEEAKYKGTKSD